MWSSPTTVVAVALSAVLAPAMSSAETVNRCIQRKLGRVEKHVIELLKCHQKAEGRGNPLDRGARRAEDKFDGGLTPARGCFAEASKHKAVCLTTGDMPAVKSTIDSFVVDVVEALDPDTGSHMERCGRKETVRAEAFAASLRRREQGAKTGKRSVSRASSARTDSFSRCFASRANA